MAYTRYFAEYVTSQPQTVSPTGIASAEAFGSAALSGSYTITATGIATSEAFGALTVTAGAVTIRPAGIASAEAFGAATIKAANTITPSGIATAETFGTATVSSLYTISPAGLPTGEAFGSATVQPGPVTVTLAGIGSGEAFGTATVQRGAVSISPAGLASAEAFGTALLTNAQLISPTAIVTSEAFGSLTVQAGPATISPAGIISAEGFGNAIIPGANSGRHYRRPRTPKPLIYFYRGQEYFGLSALRKAWQLEGTQEASESTQAKAPKKLYPAKGMLIEALTRPYTAIPGHIANPQDAIDDLYNSILTIERELAQAQLREARKQEAELGAQLQAERDKEIAFYLRRLQMQALRRDDDEAFLVILGAENPEFLILLGH